jgi:adenylate cyclase
MRSENYKNYSGNRLRLTHFPDTDGPSHVISSTILAKNGVSVNALDFPSSAVHETIGPHMTSKPLPRKHPLARLPSCSELDILLDQRIEHPEKTKMIDAKITKTFEKEKTIFILDMSGFSKAVQRYGIIHYLSMIRRMRRFVGPAVAKNKGIVVKFEADNCFAVFENPDHALAAALDIHHDLGVANIVTADESDVVVSIGIGHGKILLACDDMYGNELNLAAKLGEDVAEKNEILLTDAAKKKLKNKKVRFQQLPITVSGVTMKVHKVSTQYS